jgi:hypothetical protein
MGPWVEQNRNDYGRDEGSQQGDSHMLEHDGGEEHECEHSCTPPSGRGHRGGHGREEAETYTQSNKMRDLQRSNPLLFDGHGKRLKVETWLLDMVRCLALNPYSTNVKA